MDVTAHVGRQPKRKFTKQEVGYEHPAQGMENCGDCKHFEIERPNGCEIVTGKILAEDWCRKWAKKK